MHLKIEKNKKIKIEVSPCINHALYGTTKVISVYMVKDAMTWEVVNNLIMHLKIGKT